jgi:hypothetical protein
MRIVVVLLVAVFLGLTGGYAWSKYAKAPHAQTAAAAPVVPGHRPATVQEVEESAYYADCAAAQAAGKAPLYPGSPGYRKELDPSGVGIACLPTS